MCHSITNRKDLILIANRWPINDVSYEIFTLVLLILWEGETLTVTEVTIATTSIWNKLWSNRFRWIVDYLVFLTRFQVLYFTCIVHLIQIWARANSTPVFCMSELICITHDIRVHLFCHFVDTYMHGYCVDCITN